MYELQSEAIGMKKFGLILLTLLCLFLSSAALAEWDEERLFEYRVLENGTAEIISCSKYSMDIPLVIPSKIGGCTVTSIGENAFKSKSFDHGYSLPNTLTAIQANAFKSNYGLTEITIPNSVTYIGDGAFSECSKLEKVTLPSGKVSLDGNPFHHCSKLTDIIISSSHPSLSLKDGVLFNGTTLVHFPIGKEDKEYAVPSGTTAIGHHAFNAHWKLEKVSLPSSVVSIGDYAFQECRYLKEIKLPDHIRYLGSYAFHTCHSLISLHLPASLTEIGTGVFKECKALEEVTLDVLNPVYMIDNYALIDTISHTLLFLLPGAPEDYIIPSTALFLGDSSLSGQTLSSVSFASSFISIGDSAFEEANIGKITLPDSLVNIGSRAFYKCKGLTEILIPANVARLGKEAFSECSNLRKATVYSSVIGERAFFSCSALQELNLMDGVTELGYYSFYGCSSLPKVTIPGTVTHLANGIFPQCDNLAEVIIREGVESIQGNNFTKCFNMRISLPASLKDIASSAIDKGYNQIVWVAKGSPAEEYAKKQKLTYAYHGEKLSFPEEPGAFQTVKEVRAFFKEKAANMETEFTFHCSGDLFKLLLSDMQCGGVNIPGFSLIQSLFCDANIQKHSLTYYPSKGEIQVKCLYWQGWRLATLYEQGKMASLTEQEQKVLRTALEIVNEVKAKTDKPWQIEKLLNDAICQRIKYPSFYSDFSFGSGDLKPPKEEESVLTLLEKGIADCEGYSDTFYLLGTLAGLDVRYIVGTLDGGGHAWNLVYLDGEWHFLDVTNNDYNSSGFSSAPITNHYYYFNMGQAEAREMFAWEDRYPAVPIVSKTRDYLYYYTSHGNQIYTDLKALSSYIASCRKAGDQEIAAMVDGSIAIEEIKEMLQKDFGSKGIKSYSWLYLGDNLLLIPIFKN